MTKKKAKHDAAPQDLKDYLKAKLEAGIPLPETNWRGEDGAESVEALLLALTKDGEMKDPVDLGDGSIQLVEWNNPGGDGANMTAILKLVYPGGTVFLRANGYHSSYSDNSWDNDLQPVEPRQVTVTKYFPTHQPMGL
jgi:hypothetical protein